MRIASAAALLLAACDGATLQDLVLPELPDGGTTILYLECADQPIAAWVFRGAPAEPQFRACNGEFRLTLDVHARTIAELGLVEGAQDQTQQVGACGRQPRPEPNTTYQAGPGDLGFEEVVSASPSVQSFQLLYACPCTELLLEPIEIGHSIATGVYDQEGERLLFFDGHPDGGLTAHAVYRDRVENDVIRIEGPPGMKAVDAYLSPTGELVLATEPMGVWRGRLDGTVSSTRSPGLPGLLRVIAGPRDDSPFELFAVTDVEPQAFARFDGSSWTILDQTPPLNDTSQSAAVVWLGNARGLALQDNGAGAWWARADRLDFLPWPTDRSLGLKRVDWLNNLSAAVALTGAGRFYRFDDGDWTEISREDEKPLDNYRSLLDFPSGFIAGSRTGGIVRYIEGFGFCAEVTTTYRGNLTDGASAPWGAVIGGTNGGIASTFRVTPVRGIQ